MVSDVQTEVMQESIRRLMAEEAEKIHNGDIDIVGDCPLLESMDNEHIVRLAALNFAMVRIIRSVEFN